MIAKGFRTFVALRYVSNTRRTWSGVLAGIILVALLLAAATYAASALCFDVVKVGITTKVRPALPSTYVLLGTTVCIAGFVALSLRMFSRLPGWLVALTALLIVAAGSVYAFTPEPAWSAIVNPGGAGVGTETLAAIVIMSVAALLAVVGAFRGRSATYGFVSVAARLTGAATLLGLVFVYVAAQQMMSVDVADPALGGWAELTRSVTTAVAALLLLVAVLSTVHGLRQARRGALVCGAFAVLCVAGLFTWLAMSRGLVYADTFAEKATGLRFFIDVPTIDLASLAGVAAITAGAVLAAIVLFVLFIISRFISFYSTVSIGGVWIGTLALVVVLSVMGGFESDLREKILGSNAHIQITKEDGDFDDWVAVRARIDAVAGVRASTPFATSEVVIATNSGYYNVIIKGIETTSVAAVTDLVRDLDDPKAVERMEPLIVDDRDLVVPQGGPPESSLDPAPDDLPDGGDPIDFSGDDEPSAEAAKPDRDALPIDGLPFDEPLRRPAQKAAAIDEDADHFGGDATTLLGVEPPIVSLDPVPNDFPDDDMEPVDLDVSVTSSTPSRRTQTLHGVLVGRQLAKQIHLQTGQEVRLISPISDPSNPDATGSPIPYNRDYRVAGEFFTGMYEYDLKYVYVTLESLQSFLDRGDSIDGIEVRVPDPDGTGAVVAALQRELGPNYRVQDWRELNRNLFSALKLEKIAMFMVLGIIILVASFSIVGNLIMVVVEKGRQIALLKTLGSATFDVVVIFILQGMFIGVIGTLLGVTSGLGVCWYLSSHGFPINPDVYYIDKLPVHVDYGSVALIGVAGFVISVAATLYPAFLASRLRPAAGLRT